MKTTVFSTHKFEESYLTCANDSKHELMMLPPWY